MLMVVAPGRGTPEVQLSCVTDPTSWAQRIVKSCEIVSITVCWCGVMRKPPSGYFALCEQRNEPQDGEQDYVFSAGLKEDKL